MKREYLWALVTLIIAVVLAIILVNVVKDDPRSQPVPERQQSVYEQKLTRLERRGVDAAYTNRHGLAIQIG